MCWSKTIARAPSRRSGSAMRRWPRSTRVWSIARSPPSARTRLAASNLRQQRRLWQALERPDMAKDDNEAREADREREAALLGDILKTRTAAEWERFFQARHVPAARVRTMAEALSDPHLEGRGN